MAIGLLGAKYHGRARFYEDLAQMLDSGLPLRQALEMLATGGGPRAVPARALELRVTGGASFSDAMAADPAEFSAFERHATAAGERSGRLPDSFRALADYFTVRGKALDRMIVIAYPILLVHMAILVHGIFSSHLDSLPAYLRAVAPPILILWAVGLAAFWGYRAMRASEAGRRTVDGAALATPLLGGFVRTMALAEYAHALGLLYEAGIPIIEALDRAADATRNGVFAAAGRRVAERVRGGSKVAEALAAESATFPRVFMESVRIGETTGKLDEQLARAARQAREDSERAIRGAAVGIPAVAYVGAACYVGYVVISGWMSYFNQIFELAK